MISTATLGRTWEIGCGAEGETCLSDMVMNIGSCSLFEKWIKRHRYSLLATRYSLLATLVDCINHEMML